MRIEEIITEHVDDAKAFVNGNQIDPELVELTKRKKQIEAGFDPAIAEIVQDFPA
jgi:hypothetical protein